MGENRKVPLLGKRHPRHPQSPVYIKNDNLNRKFVPVTPSYVYGVISGHETSPQLLTIAFVKDTLER